MWKSFQKETKYDKINKLTSPFLNQENDKLIMQICSEV